MRDDRPLQTGRLPVTTCRNEPARLQDTKESFSRGLRRKTDVRPRGAWLRGLSPRPIGIESPWRPPDRDQMSEDAPQLVGILDDRDYIRVVPQDEARGSIQTQR